MADGEGIGEKYCFANLFDAPVLLLLISAFITAFVGQYPHLPLFALSFLCPADSEYAVNFCTGVPFLRMSVPDFSRIGGA